MTCDARDCPCEATLVRVALFGHQRWTANVCAEHKKCSWEQLVSRAQVTAA